MMIKYIIYKTKCNISKTNTVKMFSNKAHYKINVAADCFW